MGQGHIKCSNVHEIIMIKHNVIMDVLLDKAISKQSYKCSNVHDI